MLRSSRVWLLLILIAYLVAFLLLHERALSGYDPANFVLALKYGYSIADQRPHAPGYQGFYLVWKAIEYVTLWEPHAVILATNALFALTALTLTYFVTRSLYHERTAMLATALVATNPLFLYFSFIGEMYAYDAAFSAFLVLLLLTPPSRNRERLLYLVLGILGCFRLSSVILTLPVVGGVLVWRVYRGERPAKWAFENALAISIGTAMWLLPFIAYLGGWRAYVHVFNAAANLPTSLVQNLATFLPITLWMLNVLFLIAAIEWRRASVLRKHYSPHVGILVALIAVPGAFFAFRYYAKGYALLYLAPISILGARFLLRTTAKRSYVAITLVCNLALFLFVPFIPPSVNSVLNYQHRTTAERWQTAALRATSFFAPTLEHIRHSDDYIAGIRQILDRLPAGAYLFDDNATIRWAYPRTLEALYPALGILMTSDSNSVGLFANATVHNYNWTMITVQDSLYYLTTTDLEQIVHSIPGKKLLQSGVFSLYTIAPGDRAAFIRYINEYFVFGAG